MVIHSWMHNSMRQPAWAHCKDSEGVSFNNVTQGKKTCTNRYTANSRTDEKETTQPVVFLKPHTDRTREML